MATKSKKTEAKSVIESAAGRGSRHTHASNSGQLLKLLKPRLGCDISTLSNKYDWQHPFDPRGAIEAQEGRIRH